MASRLIALKTIAPILSCPKFTLQQKKKKSKLKFCSLWKIALKTGIGKLIVSFNVNKIPEYCRKMGFTLIPLEPIDALVN